MTEEKNEAAKAVWTFYEDEGDEQLPIIQVRDDLRVAEFIRLWLIRNQTGLRLKRMTFSLNDGAPVPIAESITSARIKK